MSLFGTGRLGLSAGCRRRSMVLLHIPDTLVGRLVLPRGRGALGRGGRDGGLADQGKTEERIFFTFVSCGSGSLGESGSRNGCRVL